MRRRSGSPEGKDNNLGFLRVILLKEPFRESGPAHLVGAGEGDIIAMLLATSPL